MKKLLILLAFVPIISFGQLQLWSGSDYSIDYDVSGITGTDTILWRFVESSHHQNLKTKGGGMAIEIIYTTLDDDDATIDFGISTKGNTFNSLDATTLPYTLDVTSDTAAITSAAPGKTAATQASNIWIFDNLPKDFWIGIWIRKNSVTSGTISVYISQ